MNFLSAENLTKSFGERILFKDITLGLKKGDKMAIIAPNGAGKTSLLRILSGKDNPDIGKVALRKGIRAGFLEQEPVMNVDISVSEYIKSAGNEILNVIKEFNEALGKQTTQHSNEANRALEIATTKMDHFQAWDYERRMIQILDRFSIINLDQKINTLQEDKRKDSLYQFC